MRYSPGRHVLRAAQLLVLVLAPVAVLATTATGFKFQVRPQPLQASPSRRLWSEALRDVLRVAGEFTTLHVLCALPELCLQTVDGDGTDPWPWGARPHTLWNALEPLDQLDRLSTEACGPRLEKRDLVLLVASSNKTMIQLVGACRSNDARYIAAWPYAEADPGQSKSYNALNAAFRVHRLRIVSMDVPDARRDVAEVPLLFYRMRPYSADAPCRVGVSPHVVAEWVPGDGFGDDPDPPLFPLRPLSDLRGCPLNVAVRQYPPFISLAASSGSSNESEASEASEAVLWEPRGHWVPLLRALEFGMNARFRLRPTSAEEMGRVRSNSSRVVPADVYMVRTAPRQGQEVPQTSRASCYAVCVPRRWRPASAWHQLLGEFTYPVWALFVVTFAATSVALSLDVSLDRRRGAWRRQPVLAVRAFSHSDVSFLLVAAMCSSVQRGPPGLRGREAKTRQRLLFAEWLFFVLVMSTAYHAVQQSLRTATLQPDSLRTLEQLSKTDIVVNGPELAREAVAAAPGGDVLVKRFRPYGVSGIVGVAPRADEAYLCTALERRFLDDALGRDESGPFGQSKHVPLDGCLMTMIEAVFALPVGSVYLHKAQSVVLRMTEVGITQHIMGNIDVDGAANQVEGSRPRPDDLGRLRPALLVLAQGHGLALGVFLLELAVGGALRPARPQQKKRSHH